MKFSNCMRLALYSALIATLLALVTFTLSWNFYDYWGGPIFGYGVILFPGNLSLVYFWHPLFSEEIDLIPKLLMILTGQFVLVYAIMFCAIKLKTWLNAKYG
ncbi:hypothetical protein ACFO4O_15750 [Glaciecola siphonariae]|uniref:Uncharacterized protein n=1 Tax=Glaciecola siphonariae TaxID=521012 RepID=A0ABV9M0K9_9ALTE